MKKLLILFLLFFAVAARAQYQVNLSCTPGTNPTGVTTVGFNFYRAPSGSTTFTLLNSTPTTTCAYSDTTTTSGTTYQYNAIEVAAVTGVTGNVLSAPSANTSVTVPAGPVAPGAPIILVVPVPPATL